MTLRITAAMDETIQRLRGRFTQKSHDMKADGDGGLLHLLEMHAEVRIHHEWSDVDRALALGFIQGAMVASKLATFKEFVVLNDRHCTDRAMRDIKAERLRQREHECFDDAHDDMHVRGALLAAAQCYLAFAERQMGGDVLSHSEPTIPLAWPWEDEWWKPKTNARRNFVVAGALALAECERLERSAFALPKALSDAMDVVHRCIGCINDIDKGA